MELSESFRGEEGEGWRDPLSDLGRVRGGLHAGGAVVDDDAVGQVRGHDKVVLHHEGGLLRVHDEALDHLRG